MTVSYVFHPVPYKGPVKNNQIYLGLGELEGCAFELSGGDLIRSILESAQKSTIRWKAKLFLLTFR